MRLRHAGPGAAHGAGGLAASWQRGGYTFESGCHWLLGSRAGALLNATWHEVFDIGSVRFVDPSESVRLVAPDGEQLPIYTDVDRLESATTGARYVEARIPARARERP